MNKIDKWDRLFIETKRLTKPFSMDNLLIEEEMIGLEKTIIDVLNSFLDKGELHKGIKIYINKVLRNDIVERMEKIRPHKSESLEEWAAKIFGNDRFGVVFNTLEAYDNNLAEIMCSIATPLIKKAGLPLGGLSFLFFMGNYGYTPFGIHKEAKGEEGFLFHLGPGKKEFFTWDTEELNEIEHNTKVFHDEVDKMLPSSKEYVLNAGSVMFIPNQVYHIANTEAFSLSIVMDYINPSRDNLEKELAKVISTQKYPQNDRKIYLPPIQLTNNGKNLGNSLKSKSIMEKFNEAFQKKVLLLKSNGGLLNKSIRNLKKQIPNNEFKLRGKKVFPIYFYNHDNDNTIIFARGNEIIKKSNSNLEDVIAKLNKGDILTLKILKNCLMPEWDLIEIYSLVNELLLIEAIDIIDLNTTTNKG